MEMGKTMVFGWETAYGDSTTTPRDLPVGMWFVCGRYKYGRATFELRGLTDTDLELRVTLQFANSPTDSSFTKKEISANKSTEAVHFPGIWTDIDAETKAHQLARIIVEARKKTVNDQLEWVRIAGTVELKTC